MADPDLVADLFEQIQQQGGKVVELTPGLDVEEAPKRSQITREALARAAAVKFSAWLEWR